MFDQPHVRTWRRAAVALGVATVGLIAVAACNPAPDAKQQTIVVVGTEPSQAAMATIASAYNGSAANTDPDTIVNVDSVQSPALTVPADSQSDCAATIYDSPPGVGETLAPKGSTGGLDALKASVANGDGCISVARSVLPPRPVGSTPGTDNATFEYYAFALDGMTWGSSSSLAPVDMSLADLQGIYNCTFTDWSQVGGQAGPIQRYWPDVNTATRSIFETQVLGFDPTAFANGSCPAVHIDDQNTPGVGILADGNTQSGISPMSAGVWSAQANGTYPDNRDGFTLHKLDGKAYALFNGSVWGVNTPAFSGHVGAPVIESNVPINTPSPPSKGVYYIYNVVDTTSKLYSQAKLLVGFNNSASGWTGDICRGNEAATISLYFAPLDTSSDNGHNLAASTCRLYTP
jgi:phosphate transport system substrate-binding protein